jgi:hypothetical protein
MRTARVVDFTTRRQAQLDDGKPLRPYTRAHEAVAEALVALAHAPAVAALDKAESALAHAWLLLRSAKSAGFAHPERAGAIVAEYERELLTLETAIARHGAALRCHRAAPVVSLAAARLRRGTATAPAIELTEKEARALAFYAIPASVRAHWTCLRVGLATKATSALARLGLIEWVSGSPGESSIGYVLSHAGALVYESRVAAGEHFATCAKRPPAT